MVRFSVPYAYGCTVRVAIRIWYVPYAYGTKYAYGIEHAHYYASIIGGSLNRVGGWGEVVIGWEGGWAQ